MTVHTSAQLNADTDADVYIKLIGTPSPQVSKSNSQKLDLGLKQREKSQPDIPPPDILFQRNQKDVFCVTARRDIGKLTGIIVGHSNKGHSPIWCPEKITVKWLGAHNHYKSCPQHTAVLPCAFCINHFFCGNATPSFYISFCLCKYPFFCVETILWMRLRRKKYSPSLNSFVFST